MGLNDVNLQKEINILDLTTFWNYAFATLRALLTRHDETHGTPVKSSCF